MPIGSIRRLNPYPGGGRWGTREIEALLEAARQIAVP